MRTRNQFALIVAAVSVVGTINGIANADVTGGSGREFIISTSGATALSAFTRAGDGTAFNRGPYSLGTSSLQIGGSTYTIGAGQRLGAALKNNPLSSEPTASADRLVYTYHEIGSINGVIDVAQAGGLLPTTSFAITSGNPFWHMGTRLNSAPANGSTLTNGYTFGGKDPVRIAWSDVRAEQAFAISGTATAVARPTAAGYGQGRNRAAGGTNYQALTPVGELLGGLGISTTRLRNESVAVVPFTVSANPGTGLSKITETDAKWLQATGRLANGANFNSSVRDIGSGTRNQGANNLGLDPSWGSGERDRVNADGTDKNPFTFAENDDRPSASITYGDKTSGSSRLRPTIQFARMGLGILSSGDVGGSGRGNGGTAPLRVLAIDWDDAGEPTSAQAGFVQPTLENVTSGKYQMWSAAQAVTVTPDGTTVQTSPSAIKGDLDDDGSGIGVHRKFLNNIRQSAAAFGNPESNQTPFDAIAAASFVPTGIMAVDKGFDGDVQSSRTRNADEQAAYDTLNTTSTLKSNLNWASPATHNGNLSDAGARYNIFAPGNNVAARDQSAANANSNLSIDIEARTVLAGDLNGDSSRDLEDVEALAHAYVSPSSFLATGTTGGTLNAHGVARNYNGAEVATTETATTTPRTVETLTYAAGEEGLIVLTDLNGNGNVAPNGANGAVASVERADVKFFLYGAAIDTTGYADKMGDGIRLGQLKKNKAIDRFNAELDALAASSVITVDQATTAKFDKLDVDGDGDRDLVDAKIVDRNVGKNYTQLADVLSTWDDLVAAELDDNNVISAVLAGGTSDFKLIRDGLAGVLSSGDTNFDGAVNFDDLLTLAQNYQASGIDQWSDGDFDLSGAVNFDDLLSLAQNYGVGTVTGTPLGEHFAADWALAQSMVPEPAILGSLATLVIASRRRRAV